MWTLLKSLVTGPPTSFWFPRHSQHCFHLKLSLQWSYGNPWIFVTILFHHWSVCHGRLLQSMWLFSTRLRPSTRMFLASSRLSVCHHVVEATFACDQGESVLLLAGRGEAECLANESRGWAGLPAARHDDTVAPKKSGWRPLLKECIAPFTSLWQPTICCAEQIASNFVQINKYLLA